MTARSSSSNVSSGSKPGAGQIGMAAAVSIGVGGMVGAGIFSILGVVAGATEKLRLVTSVLVLPYRNPVLTAKMVAAISG